MNNIYLQLLDLQRTESSLVLATVTRTIGSTPQKPGSSAIFNLAGLLSGTVGGGMLEGEVQQIAQKAILSKESGYFHFKLDREISHGEGAICGGQASILVDASPGDHCIIFEQVRQSLVSRIPGVLVTLVTDITKKRARIQRYWLTENDHPILPNDPDGKIAAEVERLLSEGKDGDYKEFKISFSGEKKEPLILLEPIFPPSHLVIAGAGHIGKALSHIGKLLDFEVTVIDDRPEYANTANLPDADHIIIADIGKAMEEVKKTPDTFVVIVTRGHKDDARALKTCIGSGIAYIGMIGSKNKVALMQKDFIQNGWAKPEEWERIHAPVGLDIQSKSVYEIAISIAAQLVQVKNSKKLLMSEIWGIVLASGESKRMKVQKLLLPFQGKTIIEKVIENVIQSVVDCTLVVVGSEKEEILGVINNLPVSYCYNDGYRHGMLSSVKCGFQSLPRIFEAALVFLGDQPMIPAEAVNRVIQAYRQSQKGIVIPVFQKKRGHPLLIDSKYREEIEKLGDQEGLRGLASKFPDDVLEVEVNLPGILRDIDTNEEYLEAINQIQ